MTPSNNKSGKKRKRDILTFIFELRPSVGKATILDCRNLGSRKIGFPAREPWYSTLYDVIRTRMDVYWPQWAARVCQFIREVMKVSATGYVDVNRPAALRSAANATGERRALQGAAQ